MNKLLNIYTLGIIVGYLLLTSSKCNKCVKGPLVLDSTRTWLPLKGKTLLTFADNTGSMHQFRLRVTDTTETEMNTCGELFSYEYIRATLFLNPAATDSIYFNLSTPGWICMNAVSNNITYVSMCDVIGQTKESRLAKKFSNYTLGSRTYPEAILLLATPGSSNNQIDSIVIADNTGIVGFKYGASKYTLQ